MALFFSGTYDEAFALLVEARDYLADQEGNHRDRLSPDLRLAANCEALRLTSRLTQVMAWLLVQKAVHAGEMTADQARGDAFRLGGHSVCLKTGPDDNQNLPKGLRDLLSRSYHLYRRIERLDIALADGLPVEGARATIN